MEDASERTVPITGSGLQFRACTELATSRH